MLHLDLGAGGVEDVCLRRLRRLCHGEARVKSDDAIAMLLGLLKPEMANMKMMNGQSKTEKSAVRSRDRPANQRPGFPERRGE